MVLLGAVEDAPPTLELAFLPDETLVWQRGAVIGGGRFGQVLLALRVPSAELLAVKQLFVQEELEQGNDVSSISLQRVQTRAHIEREVDVVRALRHENVVRVLGSEWQGPVVHIFMEYLPLGSVSKQLKAFGPLEEPTIRQYIHHVVTGLAYLHASGIAHRDLKCANLLLADDGIVKIADFGAAKRASPVQCCASRSHEETVAVANETDVRDDPQIGSQSINNGRPDTARSVREGLGTPYWMAPELVRAKKGEDGWQKADIWGVGCVTIEMATGNPPWDNLSNPLTAMFQIASATGVPLIPPHLSPVAHAFLSRCFVKDPAMRASAAELLQHPFLTGDTKAGDDCFEANAPVKVSELTATDLNITSTASGSGNSPAIMSDAASPSTAIEAVAFVSALLTDDMTTHRSPASSSSAASFSIPSRAVLARTARSTGSCQSCADSLGTPSGRGPIDRTDGVERYDDTDSDELAVYSSDDDQEDGGLVSNPIGSLPLDTVSGVSCLGLVRAIASYAAEDDSELMIREGDFVEVMDMAPSGWWRGRISHSSDQSSRAGWFPSTYVEQADGNASVIAE